MEINGGWLAFFVIVVIVAFLGLIIYSINVSVRECSNNSECNGYCGSDFKCYELVENKIGKPVNLDYQFFIALVLIILLTFVFNLIYRVK